MNGYDLSRKFIDFSFENPSKIKPNHYALYFFAIEHCNRLGWKKEFGLPTTMAMEGIGMKSYTTYIKTFNELIDFGFFDIVERSKNQYSANIVALTHFDKALDKALDKAIVKHASKQVESTIQSTVSIDKPLTNKPINQSTTDDDLAEPLKIIKKYHETTLNDYLDKLPEDKIYINAIYDDLKIRQGTLKKISESFKNSIITSTKMHTSFLDFRKHFTNWLNTQDKLGKLDTYKHQSKGQL